MPTVPLRTEFLSESAQPDPWNRIFYRSRCTNQGDTLALIKAMLVRTPHLPPCETCGGHYDWVDSLRHPDDITRRIDVYRCVQCGNRTNVTVELRSRLRSP